MSEAFETDSPPAPMTSGTAVRVRLAGDSEWCEGMVICAGGSSVMLMLSGAVRAPGGVILGALALTVDYEAETVEGLLGGEYEVEVRKQPLQ